MSFEQSIQAFDGQPLTRQVLLGILSDYQRPYDKLHELVRQQLLVQVKRGLFVAGPKLSIRPPEPFLLANHLMGPSYISVETALSYWRLIPEQVFEISSMITRRNHSYETPVGRFTYTRLPLPYFSYGQQSIELSKGQVALIASPEKALCDKIVTTHQLRFRGVVPLKQWLLEDMRIEREALRGFKIPIIESWLATAPKRQSLALLVKTLEDL
ncbi:MAG TPA: hypothetical protein VK666_24890 [Chryseolinea sp.]|nr:hypothetical protein [Chryseolinea sp.]